MKSHNKSTQRKPSKKRQSTRPTTHRRVSPRADDEGLVMKPKEPNILILKSGKPPRETLEDVISNTHSDLVCEWLEQRAHHLSLLNLELDEEELEDDLWFKYWEEEDESTIADFDHWLAKLAADKPRLTGPYPGDPAAERPVG
jgi:hypothetical protein